MKKITTLHIEQYFSVHFYSPQFCSVNSACTERALDTIYITTYTCCIEPSTIRKKGSRGKINCLSDKYEYADVYIQYRIIYTGKS